MKNLKVLATIILIVATIVVSLPRPQPVEAAPAPAAGAYVVRSGDTLYSIAQRYGVTVAALQAANNLTDPNVIWVGQRLVIPSSQPEAAPAPAAAPATAPATTAAGAYVVQSGDTLYSIARRYGVTVAALQAANSLANPNRIWAGQHLVVPGRGSTAAAMAPATPTAPATISPPPPTNDFDRRTGMEPCTPGYTSMNPGCKCDEGHWHWIYRGLFGWWWYDRRDNSHCFGPAALVAAKAAQAAATPPVSVILSPSEIEEAHKFAAQQGGKLRVFSSIKELEEGAREWFQDHSGKFYGVVSIGGGVAVIYGVVSLANNTMAAAELGSGVQEVIASAAIMSGALDVVAVVGGAVGLFLVGAGLICITGLWCPF